MTIEEFRKNEQLLASARAVLQNPTLVLMMEILKDAGPENVPVNRGITPTEAHISLGDTKGFARYPVLLKAFARPWPLKGRQPEATYADPDKP